MEKIRLTSVRPFRTEDVSLREHNLDPSKPEEIEAFLQQRVKRLIAKCKLDSEGNPEAKEKLPLIRIRVDYSGGFLSFNAKRFGQQFVSVVANPRDILLFFRKATPAPKGAAKGEELHRSPLRNHCIGIPSSFCCASHSLFLLPACHLAPLLGVCTP